MNEEKPCVNPIGEQRKSALKHYHEVSGAANHWSGFVEAAIKAYNPPTTEQPITIGFFFHEITKRGEYEYVVRTSAPLSSSIPSIIEYIKDKVPPTPPYSCIPEVGESKSSTDTENNLQTKYNQEKLWKEVIIIINK